MESLWECSCGNKVYAEEDPEECEKCFEIGKFTQLPEELVEERQKDMAEMEEEVQMKKVSKAKKPTKGRRKK